jgi:hypothetical protein
MDVKFINSGLRYRSFKFIHVFELLIDIQEVNFFP